MIKYPYHCNLACSIDLKSILSSMDDFKNIKPETLQAILDVSHIREYSKDTTLYYENDKMSDICYLFHGYVKVSKINKFDNEVIISLYTNHCANISIPPLINYHAMLDGSYNIYCLESCRILRINVKFFNEIIKTDQQLALNMLNRANEIIKEQEYTISLNMIYDAKAKIVSILCKHPDIFRTLNKKTISQMLNISQETLSRSLQKLKDEQVISMDNAKDVVILDETRLRNIFESNKYERKVKEFG